VVLLYVKCERLVAYIYPVEWRKGSVAIVVVCFLDMCLDGSGFVYAGLERASSFARSSWRFTGAGVTAEGAAGCTRAASPSATDNCCCYTIITTTNYHKPLHCTRLPTSSATPPSAHLQARADTHHTSPTSLNTANMVLEATMIVYVPLPRRAPAELRAYG
jgi:hypothetical protein